jgi:Zn-dependent protease with chaperone function
MYQLKILISSYSLIFNIVGLLLIIGISLSFYFHKDKNLIVPKVFSLIFIFISFFVIKPLILKTYPLYKKGECFKYEKVINEQPSENWHKPFLKKKLEFLVLKVGKKNYYVSTTEPKLEDFPINLDGLSRKSDCSELFGKK